MMINNFLNLKPVFYVFLFSIFCMGVSANAAVSSQSIQNQDDLSEIRNKSKVNKGKSTVSKRVDRVDRFRRVIGSRVKATLHRTSDFLKLNKRRSIRLAAYILLSLLIVVPTYSIIAAQKRAEARRRAEGRFTIPQVQHAPEVYAALGVRHGADPYEILGINRDATQDELQAAFRSRIKAWHPDKNRNRQELTTGVSQALNQARDAILKT